MEPPTSEIMSWTFHSEVSGDFRRTTAMPNWCENKLTIQGPEKGLFAFKHRARGVGPCYSLSKWDREQLAKDPAAAENVEPSPISLLQFHSLVPVPQYLQDKTYGGEEEAREAGVVDSTGPTFAGNAWEVWNWGCKLGAVNPKLTEARNKLVYDFDTPWAPPFAFLLTASKLFPSLTFRIEFAEPNMNFAGFAVVQNGEVVDREVGEMDRSETDEEETEGG
jgi:hypothetical protein